MAIDTGPTVATADCRSVSLPLVTSVKPVHVATASLLSNLHFLSYKTDDKMNEFSNNLSRNITHIVLALNHWWQ
jgi:hypothetical protein